MRAQLLRLAPWSQAVQSCMAFFLALVPRATRRHPSRQPLDEPCCQAPTYDAPLDVAWGNRQPWRIGGRNSLVGLVHKPVHRNLVVIFVKARTNRRLLICRQTPRERGPTRPSSTPVKPNGPNTSSDPAPTVLEAPFAAPQSESVRQPRALQTSTTSTATRVRRATPMTSRRGS